MSEQLKPEGFIIQIGFKWIGETRLPQKGEYYQDHDGVWKAEKDFKFNAWPIVEPID